MMARGSDHLERCKEYAESGELAGPVDEWSFVGVDHPIGTTSRARSVTVPVGQHVDCGRNVVPPLGCTDVDAHVYQGGVTQWSVRNFV